MEFVERKYRAAARLDPENFGGVAAVGHRENADGIAPQQQSRSSRLMARDYPAHAPGERHAEFTGFRAPHPPGGTQADALVGLDQQRYIR